MITPSFVIYVVGSIKCINSNRLPLLISCAITCAIWSYISDFYRKFGPTKSCNFNRNLFAIKLQSRPFENDELEAVKQKVKAHYSLTDAEVNYFFVEGHFTNTAYHPHKDKISIYYKDGSVLDVAEASEQLNMEALASHADKYFMAWPKEMAL